MAGAQRERKSCCAPSVPGQHSTALHIYVFSAHSRSLVPPTYEFSILSPGVRLITTIHYSLSKANSQRNHSVTVNRGDPLAPVGSICHKS